jgi:hypothetical protein
MARKLHPQTRRILEQLARYAAGATSKALAEVLYGSDNGAAVSGRLNGLAARGKELVVQNPLTGVWQVTEAGRQEVEAAAEAVGSAPAAAPADGPRPPTSRYRVTLALLLGDQSFVVEVGEGLVAEAEDAAVRAAREAGHGFATAANVARVEELHDGQTPTLVFQRR